jgi:hypothetical protein
MKLALLSNQYITVSFPVSDKKIAPGWQSQCSPTRSQTQESCPAGNEAAFFFSSDSTFKASRGSRSMQNSMTISDLISPFTWMHSGYEQGALDQLSTGLAIPSGAADCIFNESAQKKLHSH